MVEFGLIGYPLEHSFSAEYFNKIFQRDRVEGKYTLYPIRDVSSMESIIEYNPNLRGLNVTIPYKETVCCFLDNISEEVSEIKAVNVIKIIRDKNERHPGPYKLIGYNTDWIGFVRSLSPILDNSVSKALILGTGGASKAIAFGLKKMGIKYTFVSRNKKDYDTLAYDDLNREIIENHLLIINTTPLGMFPNEKNFPDIPYEFLTSNHLCYDLIYNPAVTEFMKKSSFYGAKVKNGLEMLHLQADEALRIWMSEDCF